MTVAIILRRRRDLLLGIALGLALDFWRDMSESGSGVALLWPWSDRSFHSAHWGYGAATGAVIAVNLWHVRVARAPPAASRRRPQ